MAKKKTTGATLTGEKIPVSKLTEKDKKTLGSLTVLE
jgi:hypothetical protein